MNDEFMDQLYEEPRAEFANRLYDRISHDPSQRFARPLSQYLTFRNSAIAFVFLFFVAACVYVVAQRGWHKVGGFWINVQQTITVDVPAAEISTGTLIQPPESECLTVEEAKETLRFKLKVPTWAPEGFVLDDRICGIDQISDFATVSWAGADEYSGIYIMMSNLRYYDAAAQEYKIGDPSIWSPVAPDSYQEVQVNGKPAILIHGDWDWPWETWKASKGPAEKRELQWVKGAAIQLYWVNEGMMYHLSTNAFIPDEDLLKMAESTQ